jgi:gonadotropin-releasing hormone receptor
MLQMLLAGSDMATLTTEFSPTTEFLSDDMKFNDGHRMSIITYSVLMAVSAVGNITVLVNMLRRRRSLRFGNNYMFMHLAIADLLVSAGTTWLDPLTQ